MSIHHTMTHAAPGPDDGDAKARLVAVAREHAPERLRDVIVFTTAGHETLYVREDVEARLDGVAIEEYLDQERFGHVVAATYEDLHYAEYAYTVRGFDTFDQFRCLLGPDRGLGLLVSYDATGDPVDWGRLAGELRDVAGSVGADRLLPRG